MLSDGLTGVVTEVVVPVLVTVALGSVDTITPTSLTGTTADGITEPVEVVAAASFSGELVAGEDAASIGVLAEFSVLPVETGAGVG